MTAKTTDPRFVLRDATRHEHDRIDAAFGTLDLATREGLTMFLQAHRVALEWLEPFLSASDGAPAIPPRLTLIDADLAELGAAPLASPPEREFRGSPLGHAYVFAGSHLGAKLIDRRRRTSQCREVLAANRYLCSPEIGGLWQSVLAQLADRPSDCEDFERLKEGAVDCFVLFSEALEYVRTEHERHRSR